MFEISFFSVAIFVVALSIFNLSLVIWLGSREYTSRIFAFTIFFVATWSFVRGLFHSVDPTADPIYMFYNHFPPDVIATILNKLSFLIGGIVASSFMLFSLSLPNNKRYPRLTGLLVVLFLAHTFIYIGDQYFLGKTFYIGGIEGWAWGQGPFLGIYDVYFFTLWFTGLYAIAHKASRARDINRTRLHVMYWAMVAGLTSVSFFTMILPRYGIYQFDWLSSIFMLIWPTIIAYSIMKHGQMNVRAVYAEMLVFICVLLLFVSIFI